MNAQFANMTLDQMLALNVELCAAIREKQSDMSRKAITTIVIGDRIHYRGSRKTPGFFATVEKVLKVNIDVITDAGQKWRLPASSVTKVPA